MSSPMRMLLCLLALSSAARAADSARSLAVLEFQSKLPRDEADVGYLSDVVRTAAKDASGRLKVMTRENMLVLLQASGKKVEECEGECEVETGRRIGADLVISGQVLKFGTQFKVTMKLHETRSGELLQGAQASGGNLDELDKNLTAAVVKLVGPLGNGEDANFRSVPPPQGETDSRKEADVQAGLVPSVPPPASPLGFGLDALAGYYTWSINIAGSGSESGLSYGLTGHAEYKVGPLGIGVLAQYSSMKYSTEAGGSASVSAIAIGPMARLRVSGNTAIFAAVAYTALSDNNGSGPSVVAGIDIPVVASLALRGQFEYRSASGSMTLNTGSTVDVTSTILAGQVGLGLLF